MLQKKFKKKLCQVVFKNFKRNLRQSPLKILPIFSFHNCVFIGFECIPCCFTDKNIKNGFDIKHKSRINYIFAQSQAHSDP